MSLKSKKFRFIWIALLLSIVASFFNGCGKPDDKAATTLLTASLNGNIEAVKLLLEAKADVNKAYTSEATPLYLASTKGHTEVVKLLLGAMADVNQAEAKYGATPLIIASRGGHTEVAKLLLEAKADVNVKVKAKGKEYTALSLAKEGGHTRIVELLKVYGAKE